MTSTVIEAYEIARKWVCLTDEERVAYEGDRTLYCTDLPVQYELEDGGGVTSILEQPDGELVIDPTFGSGLIWDIEDDEPEWDEQDEFCSDCPPEECDGHCMSCRYR